MKQFLKSILTGALATFFGFFLIVFSLFFFSIVIVKGLQGRAKPIEENSVLHLDLYGELTERTKPFDFDFISPSPFSAEEKGVGLYELTKAIKVAKEDPKIKGIYMELRDLDAGWAATEALRRAIQDFKDSGKFVYAYSSFMNEHTYYLASVAEKIYLQPHGELEFNGFSIDGVFLKGLLGKLNIEPRIFRVGKFKSAVEPFLFEQMSEENRQQNQTLVNDVWSVFKSGILTKTLTESDVDLLASNLAINSPTDAFNKGLIHELAFEDEVLKMISGKISADDIWDQLVSPGQILNQTVAEEKSENKIAVLFAEGEIVEGMGDRTSIASRAFVDELIELRQDDDVKAIVLRVNSPGGDALASDVIWRELKVTDREIPVVASMGDVAASGGYYIAAGARHIFAEASTLTGSIGVFGLMFETKEFFNQKLGVNFDQVGTHPHADLGNPNRPMTDKERIFIQNSVERVYRRFIDVVKDSRGLPDTVDASQFAEGRVWSGLRAKEMKLVDDIGGLDAAIRKAAEIAKLSEGDYEVEIYPEEGEALEEFLDMMTGQVRQRLIQGTILEQLQSQIPGALLKPGVYARLPFDVKIK